MSYELDPEIKSEKVIKKTYAMKSTGVSYKILKYDDGFVCDNDEKLGPYRSVVFSEPEGQLLCFSPPKAITPELFKERYPEGEGQEETETTETTEAVEGIMLSLFWDDRINAWELASKGAIGANYWFFRTQYKDVSESTTYQKTFRQMFLEAFRATEGQDLNDLVFIKELPKGDVSNRICYNFVIQHPDNHIVLDIKIPKVFLVSVYGILPNKNIAEFVSPKVYKEWAVFHGVNNVIEFPEDVSSEEDMPWSIPGHMILNTRTGDRTCLENPGYKEIRDLRGNNPNLHYHYLCLLRIGKILDFLGYFPQYKKIFSEFYNQFEAFVTKTHQYYVSYYVKKQGRPVPKNYFMLIHRLHKDVYLPSLADPTKKIILKRPVIRSSILNLTPNEIMFYLYDKVSEPKSIDEPFE